jgi:hypothetical protein
LRAGDLEPHRAQQVVDEVPTNNPGVCAAVEAALFPRIVERPTTRVGMLARKAVAAADPDAAADRAARASQGRFVFAGPSGLPGLMRLEAELESGRGRLVWAAIQELAVDYVKQGVAATIDAARADALVDLVLTNVVVTKVVDLALPAGFASGPRPGSGAGGGGGGSVLEERAIAVVVDADQNRDGDGDRDVGPEGVRDMGHGSVLRLLTGLPAAGVLDHRVGTLTSATPDGVCTWLDRRTGQVHTTEPADYRDLAV